jgi:hypothetical protein
MNHSCPSLLFAGSGKWKPVSNSRYEKCIQRFASGFRSQKILVELHGHVSEFINCERIAVKTDRQFKQSRAVMNTAKVFAFDGVHARCLCFSHGVVRGEYLCRRRVAHRTCIQRNAIGSTPYKTLIILHVWQGEIWLGRLDSNQHRPH